MPIEEWTRWQSERPSADQMGRWYAHGAHTGIGFVCGAVSGNLEMFEFDDRPTYDVFKERAALAGLGDLVARIEAGYLEDTPGGGVHWFYRCDEVTGNTKLAREETGDPANPVRVLIETRGEGGYAVAAPSNGTVHPSGKAYRLLAGGPRTIASITSEERGELWALARSFDRTTRQVYRVAEAAGDWLVRPGEAFAATASWEDVLAGHGWDPVFTRGEETYWRRPGKERAWSATTNYKGSDLLYVFSSSTPFEPERGYGKFAAYAVLEHGGDFKIAAAALADKGYGQRQQQIDPETGEIVEQLHLTDMGNAERLIARHGIDLRYCAPWKRWAVWGGETWADNGDDRVQERAKETVRSIYEEGIGVTSPERAQAIWKHAVRSESAGRVAAMIQLARSATSLAVAPEDLDRDPWLLNCANGTVDLRTGDLRPFARDDLMTKRSPARYDARAACPTWIAFLERIFAGDADLIGFMQRSAGYSLTGSTAERVMFILFGAGRNGKSTFLEVVRHVMGAYASGTPASTIMAQRNKGIPNDIARLKGARFVSASETSEAAEIDEAFIKVATGGDVITARFLNAEFFDFLPQFKIWLATNHKPSIKGTDPAVWDRIRLVPFTVRIPDDQLDKALRDKLIAEADGILQWLIAGCLDWRQRGGLGEPDAVAAATAEYRVGEDTFGPFLADRCDVQPAVSATAKELYAAYLEWAAEAGEEKLSQRRFGDRLRAQGFRAGKGTAGRRRWAGLRVLSKTERAEGADETESGEDAS